MTLNLNIKDKSDGKHFLKAASFRKDIRKTEPHKHNGYFEIIYLTKAKGFHSIDNKKYELNPPVLFFIRHEQVHHWDLDENTEPEGYVLILKKHFFEKTLDGELKQLLSQISKISCSYLNESPTINKLFALLVAENITESDRSFTFSEGIVKSLFSKIIEVANPFVDRHQKKELYQSFVDLLIRDHSKKNKVSYYASILNTTPQNLNAVCRKAVDLSAADIMAEHLVNEAKRLLVYTDSTISEISFDLSFKDPSHFTKYFKRHTTLTPQKFRSIKG
jgi:AraC family transcriptional regulator, transcriptional activator of pobA